jgi:NAD(P)-dependent dehydrogenase (short-subunit alcohol dehydrogenase family)
MPTMNIFRDKVAIVTGGASGIGKALCAALVEREATVVVVDVDAARAAEVAKALMARPGRARAATLDVCDAAAFQKLLDDTVRDHGRLDYLFNNAGIAIGGEARDIPDDDWKRVLDVDLYGVIHGTRAAYRRMVDQGFGHIVNTASLAGLVPAVGEVPYAAAKYGVVGLSHSLRAEGAGLGVKVSVVCPGFIDTPILMAPIRGPIDAEKIRAFMPKAMPPERCARIILKGVEENRATIIVTGLAWALWWIARASPDAAVWISRQFVDRVRKVTPRG